MCVYVRIQSQRENVFLSYWQLDMALKAWEDVLLTNWQLDMALKA